MQFRISDTFTDSLTRLTADEQKAVKITAFDLQQNPANPGMQLHRIEKSKDKHFWSVRVGSDLRLPWLTRCVASMRQHSRNPGIVILVGGPVFSTRPELPGQIGADLCADAVSAPALAAAMVAERQQNANASHCPAPTP